jgi:single-strand DNA-binding protein
MASFNKVILAGNLTRDPELRYTAQGHGGGANRPGRQSHLEKRKRRIQGGSELRRCGSLWGRQAEVIAQYMRKGRPLLVEGRLKLDTWEDKTTHQKKSKLKVVLEGFSFIDSKGPEGGGGVASRRGCSPPARCRAAERPSPPDAPESEAPPPEEDDVPF